MAYSSRSLVAVMGVEEAPRWSSRARTGRVRPAGPRVDPHRAGSGGAGLVGRLDGVAHPLGHVVRVDQEGGAYPEAGHLGPERLEFQSWARVKACIEAPTVAVPYRRPAARFEVAANPAMEAAGCHRQGGLFVVCRLPISMRGRPRAASTIRVAAEAMAESWFTMLRTSVSIRQASANVASTRSTGEYGKGTVSPSR